MSILTAVVLAPLAPAQDEVSVVVRHGLRWQDWSLAAGVLFGFAVVGVLCRIMVERLVSRSDAEGLIARFVGRLVQNVLVVVGFIYALNVLGVAIGPLVGALGIGGIAIAFALQAILENAFASVVLKTRKPIAVGDEITTNGHTGEVEAINFRSVILRNTNGETVVVPSSMVNSDVIVNQTERGIRRTVLPVGVAYDTDLRLAQQTLLAAVAAADGVMATPEPRAWVTQFGDSSIDFVVNYWHRPDIATANRIRSGVAMAIKEALDDAGIVIPFPQRVVTVADSGDEG